MAHRIWFFAIVVAILFSQSGCSDKEESNPITPPPSLSGTWDLEVADTEPESPIWLELNEENGNITGSYKSSGGSIPLTGTISSSGDVAITFQETDPSTGYTLKATLNGSANEQRSSIQGTFKILLLPLGSELLNRSFTATRR